ncbi:hypothetical protein D3C86_1093380 [compost metagenome]
MSERFQKLRGEQRVEPLCCVTAEHDHRNEESARHGYEAEQAGAPAPPAGQRLQPVALRHACRLRRAEALFFPGIAFDDDQCTDDNEDDGGDLGGIGKIAAIEPGLVDGKGQRLDAEIFDRANIVQRLHQDQRQADGNRRPRHRQLHGEEHVQRLCAKRAGRISRKTSLHGKGGARREIDIGIEYRAQNDDSTAERAYIRKPVIADAVITEDVAKGALHRAGKVEKLTERIGCQIGRNGERQDKCCRQ